MQKNCAEFGNYGLTFDLQVFAGQMDGAARLAAACTNTTFVLHHAGMLEDLTSAGRAAWGRGMDRLAACPNVMVKLSDFGTFVHRVDPGLIARLWRETPARFGPARCLWGSNFPNETLRTGHSALLAAHLAAAEPQTAADRAAVFHDDACRVVRF